MDNVAMEVGSRNKFPANGSMLLRDYLRDIQATDELPEDDLSPVLFGLYGEVGSILSTAKKLHREKDAYVGYQKTREEEFGDVLWYFAALCRRVNASLEDIFSKATESADYQRVVAANDLPHGPVSHVSIIGSSPSIQKSYLDLGSAIQPIIKAVEEGRDIEPSLHSFADCYLRALQASELVFARIVQTNLTKALGRFIESDYSKLPIFDASFLDEERLPDKFEIKITQRSSGQSYLQWNGVFIGDPLTDNIRDPDGYRFHDVFHMAHAAILHWSPTFRALIKHKRKSRKDVDEAQDGGRAIVVEEGLTAWIYSRAKELDFFRGQDRVSFDMLKTIAQFVQGYEVEACPLKLWERAILRGYDVFLKVRENNGGIVIGDRQTRNIEFKALV